MSDKFIYTSLTSVSSYQSQSSSFFDYLGLECMAQLILLIKNRHCMFWTFTEEGNNTGLHVCAMRGLNTIIQTLFNQIEENFPEESFSIINSWINKSNDKGDVALHYLSYRGNIEIIRLFDQYNCNVKITNKQGNNVLHFSAQGNKPSTLVYFIEKYGFNPDQKNNEGSTALHWACYTGSDMSLKFLIKWSNNIDLIDNDGFTPLHLAVLSERSSLVKRMLLFGASRKIIDKKGRTAKALADEKGNDELSKLLEEQISCPMLFRDNKIAKHTKSRLPIIFFVSLNIFAYFFTFSIILPGKIIQSYAYSGLNNIHALWITTVLMSTNWIMYLYLYFADPGVRTNMEPGALYVSLYLKLEYNTRRREQYI